MFVYSTKANIPYNNFAIEEYLLDKQPELKETILFIWQNDKSVIIGRNQDIYSECDLDFLKKNSILPARRKTGGGAVYHDLGNINFSFICSKEEYNRNLVTETICNCLKHLDIDAYASGRNDIEVDGYKVSGHAFRSNDKSVLHHGTIMFDVDLYMMEKALHVEKGKIARKGIKSVRSRVKNLVSFNNTLSLKELTDSLIEEFELVFGKAKDIDLDEEVVTKIASFYSGPEWIYGDSIDSVFNKTFSFNWGEATISLKIVDGNLTKLSITSDSLLPEELIKYVDECNNRIDELETYIDSKQCLELPGLSGAILETINDYKVKAYV